MSKFFLPDFYLWLEDDVTLTITARENVGEEKEKDDMWRLIKQWTLSHIPSKVGIGSQQADVLVHPKWVSHREMRADTVILEI